MVAEQAGYQVLWKDRRGAGRVNGFTTFESLCGFLEKLKCAATVRHDGRSVGGVWKNEGRWVWSVEKPE